MSSRVTASPQELAAGSSGRSATTGALVTNPHDPEHTASPSADEETTEILQLDVVSDDGGVPMDAGQPVAQKSAPRRRWSRGHTIAAAVIAVGALVAGGVVVAGHDDDSTSTAAGGQPTVGPDEARQQPTPGQDPLSSLGQLDVGQLDGLLNQLSDGRIDSDQLRALLALLGLPDHLDAGQLRDLLQQLGGGHLLDGAGGTSSGSET
jgi:hypothetical protein